MTSHLGITQHQHSPQPSQTRVKYLVWFSFGEVRSLYREPLDGADVFTPIEGIGREGGIDHSDWVPVDVGPRGIFGGLCWTMNKEYGATWVVDPNCTRPQIPVCATSDLNELCEQRLFCRRSRLAGPVEFGLQRASP